MDEKRYEKLASEAFERVMDMFEEVDPEDADIVLQGDVIRIDYRGGDKVVLNTQRPSRQLWLAGGKSAWHFSYAEASGRWIDAKHSEAELFETLRSLTRGATGVLLT